MDESGIDLESDERTIRLLNAEVSLLRKRAANSDKYTRRVEALADAAAARLTERGRLLGKEIALLRKRVASSHKRERELKAAAKASLERAADRGEMLHEVNHRAKNSIQMAISLLDIQRHASDDPQVRLALASGIERLGHIARVHSMLYMRAPDSQDVDFGEYLKTFCEEIRVALAHDVEVICPIADQLKLDSSRAVNLALIVSEGVTNALKHAFPDARTGAISVELRRRDELGTLTVQDNGVGLAGKGKDTMGMKLVRTLVKGINGKLRIDSAEGTRLQVTFPL